MKTSNIHIYVKYGFGKNALVNTYIETNMYPQCELGKYSGKVIKISHKKIK